MMQPPSALLVLAAAATVLANPQGKFGAEGGKGTLGGGAGAAGCSPVEIVYARGTMEAQGLGMIGTPLLNAAKRLIPGITAYAVRYPATFGAKSPEDGAKDILAYFEQKPKACPDQKYVLSGYSQGAVVQHRAAIKFSKDTLSRIIATVTFGDGGQQAETKANGIYNSPVGEIPKWPVALQGRVKFNCNGKDLTCNKDGKSTADHLGYTGGTYISSSAKFIQQQYEKSKAAGGATAPASAAGEE